MNIHKSIFLSLFLSSTISQGSILSFSNTDFTVTTAYNEVETFNLFLDLSSSLSVGASYNDPSLSNIQYGVNGDLPAMPSTPSGFPSFTFRLNQLFPSSPPITSAQFYGLNGDSPTDGKLRFDTLAGADLSNGLQLDELAPMTLSGIDYLSAGTGSDIATASGSNVIFHFNGREEGSGRYHPTFIRLYDDGTGIIMNADNMGGINPQDGSPDPIDVDFGEEYVTNFTFNPSLVTVSNVPEPTSFLMSAVGFTLFLLRRRK